MENGNINNLLLQKNKQKKINLRNNVAHTWNGKQEAILSFPNNHRTLAAMLVFKKGSNGYNSFKSEGEIENFIKKHFPILHPILPSISESLLNNPKGSFVTIHTDPMVL